MQTWNWSINAGWVKGGQIDIGRMVLDASLDHLMESSWRRGRMAKRGGFVTLCILLAMGACVMMNECGML